MLLLAPKATLKLLIVMLFVIQVEGRSEEKVIKVFKDRIDPKTYNDIFVVYKEKLIRKEKKWIKVNEKLFSGYVFVNTSDPKVVAKQLYPIPFFTRMVGQKDKVTLENNFTPLSYLEENMINRMVSKEENNHVIPLSEILILKDKTIRVIEGALMGMEGQVIRIDPHKKNVTIRVTLMGQYNDIVLSAEYVKVKED